MLTTDLDLEVAAVERWCDRTGVRFHYSSCRCTGFTVEAVHHGNVLTTQRHPNLTVAVLAAMAIVDDMLKASACALN